MKASINFKVKKGIMYYGQFYSVMHLHSWSTVLFLHLLQE